MSSFLGAVSFAGAAADLPGDIGSPPDEIGLRSCARFRAAHTVIAYRDHAVTPADQNRSRPCPAWGGQGWVCFTGRLDDRAVLADALDLEFAEGIADSLLACRALERWGEEGIARLLGEFALAAWHDGERRLIIAGDLLGSRTIYYCRRADMVLFSTTLRGLLASPHVSRALDECHIADFLARNCGDDDATFYRDIRKVIPGHGVVIEAERTRTIAGRRLDPDRRLRLKDDQAYVEAARELLDQAVADRLRAAGPVLISASSGLDSACIAVSAASRGVPVTLLTAVPDPGLPTVQVRGRYGDERPPVEALVAALPGLTAEFHPPPVDTDWSPDQLTSIAAGGIPSKIPFQMPWFGGVHRRAAALGASSILGGAFGNFFLSWDGIRGLQTLLCRGRLVPLARELVLGSHGHPRRFLGLVKRGLVHPLLGGRIRPLDLEGYSALDPQVVKDFAVIERLRQRGNSARFAFRGDSRQLRLHGLRRNRFWSADQLSVLRSLYGLQESMPLADPRLIDFCLAIPEDQFLRDGTDRYLARRLLRAAGVPAVITENRQRGYQHPEWFAHMSRIQPSLPAQIDRIRRSPTARRLIDLDRLDHIVAHWPRDAAEAERRKGEVRTLLNGALSAGTFIAWAEGTN
ncbi:MAG: asparagine synthetase B family protein [Azospirillaceae bacterium]|nr:asparagine synthetase B family protein [Azospirillaceae bacterium]